MACHPEAVVAQSERNSTSIWSPAATTRPGDCVFLYSNGVRSSCGDKGESFGDRRILDLLNMEPEATPSVLIQTVKHEVELFADASLLSDDLTMLSMKYYGNGENDLSEPI